MLYPAALTRIVAASKRRYVLRPLNGETRHPASVTAHVMTGSRRDESRNHTRYRLRIPRPCAGGACFMEGQHNAQPPKASQPGE